MRDARGVAARTELPSVRTTTCRRHRFAPEIAANAVPLRLYYSRNDLNVLSQNSARLACKNEP